MSGKKKRRKRKKVKKSRKRKKVKKSRKRKKTKKVFYTGIGTCLKKRGGRCIKSKTTYSESDFINLMRKQAEKEAYNVAAPKNYKTFNLKQWVRWSGAEIK